MSSLADDLADRLTGRVAVVGVGETTLGDDGVGPLIARLLADAGVRDVIDSGPSPELDTWRLREMNPDTVLFVDAVDFGGKPGDTALLQMDELRSSALDTHRAPLKLTMCYLARELGCQCYLLAVQPRAISQGATMCREVEDSAIGLAGILGGVMGVPA